MSARLLVAMLLMTAAFAGCLVEDGGSGSASLKGVFGERLQTANGTQLVVGSALVANVTSGGTPLAMDGSLYAVQVNQKVAKPATMGPGGGIARKLDFGGANITAVVALDASASGLMVRYNPASAKVRPDAADPAWTQWVPSTSGHALPLMGPGALWVYSEVKDANGAVALVEAPLMIGLKVTWTIESSVFPLGAPDTPGYANMRDSFKLDLASAAEITASTKFRGTFAPPAGLDVDLEITGGKTPCVYSADGGVPPGNMPVPPTNFALESATKAATAGAYAVNVGTIDCTEGVYANTGSVPYTLTLVVDPSKVA